MALTINRHPVLIDNETQVAMDLQPGESLYAFLYRHIENLDGQQLVVSVGGREVCRSEWHALKPKDGDNIYVRFVVQKSALLIVALIALSVFTAGAAAAIAGGAATGIGGAFGGFLVAGMGTLAANAVVGAIQIVGAMLINKVLGPKPARPDAMNRDSVYSFSSTRNNVRQYEPLALLFGVVRVTPDLLSLPYTSYRNNDQYMGMVLTPGVNVARFDPLLIGDTPLSTYEGVQVFTSGFSGMPDQVIPLYSNVDTLDGAELAATFGVPGAWVERVGPAETTRIQINLSYLLFDVTSKGKKKDNQETVVAEFRKVGDANWSIMGSYRLVSREQTEQRRSFSRDVELGQYEVRVRRLGQDTDGSGATCNFNLTSVQFVQADNADYDGIPRIGLEMKATGQLNGSPSQVRGLMYADTMPYWDGTAWVDATVENEGLSNPGAQILKYVRGFYNGKGELIAGMGLSDELIDIESFKAFMVHCAENNFRYDKHLTDARSHDEIISTIALAAMGKYSWSPGRLTMLWVAEGQPHEGVATMANIKSGEFQIDYSLSQSADGIEYTYIDRATWEQKTLRVPAPGVLVMENPARLTGDGVGDEQHAATLARYHLAQNLYQFKDIVFGQDLEHLAYGELSVIMLSHDMTQWGFSGRLVAASNTVDGILIELDEDVPAASGNTPYVGLRIPGEGNYRVFQVERVASNMLKLIGTWPAGVPFPGVGANNPTHDTIWLYDFKQTPGLRCRVIGISPADNLNGASISVVPESDEFWNYVKTGEYLPPVNESQLQTQPQVRNLLVQEEVVNQGNTVFSMIHAQWLVEGVADRFTVSVAGEDGVYRQLSETDALAYQWRMDTTGQITVLVRPIDENGVPGVAQSFQLTVYGADRPPILASEFDVIQLGAGVRKYTWSFADQSPDLAGVEIRMVSGVNLSPVWEDMTPVGDTGFFTAPFEATIPAAGSWTFALRSINTNGVLSDEMRVIARTLGKSLGQNLADITSEQVAQQQAIDQAVAAALAADLKAAKALVLIGDEYDSASTYVAGDVVYFGGRMYRALGNVPMDSPPPAQLLWADVGTVTEAQASTALAVSQLRVDVDEQGQQFAAAIDQVESGLASVTQTISASGGSGNLISNSFFASDTAGWSVGWGQTSVNWERNWLGVNMPGAGVMLGVGTPAQGAVGRSYFSSPVSVDVRNKYIGSAYVASSGDFRAYVFLIFYDAVGNELPAATSPQGTVVFTDGAQWSDISLYERLSTPAVNPPAGTATCRIMIRPMGLGGGVSAIGFTKAMVEEAATHQTQPSPWSAGGSEMAASHTIALDVNGHVSGTQSTNDGKRSSFSILASVFRVISNIVNAGMEWQGGYLRMWKGGAQLVMGHTFGSGDLIFWYGPNIGSAACTKGNGTIWFDTGGGAYFGGTLSAGVRKNAAQSTQVSGVASVETGQFGTVGNPKVVTASLSYYNYFTTASNLGTSNTPLSATLILERSYAGGAWTQVQSATVNGTRVFDGFEAGIGYSYGFSLGGSFNFTDNLGGTGNFNYRVRVANASGWPFTKPEGGIDASGSQTTSVVSVEQ